MAGIKITDLLAFTGSPEDSDLLIVSDIDGDSSKGMTFSTFVTNVLNSGQADLN